MASASKQTRNNLRLRTAAVLGLLLGTITSIAQITGDGDAAMPPTTVEDALYQMSSAAGVIFTGQVTAIRQFPGQGGASGIVEIDFLVNNAVRSCLAGQTYTLREWAGLWTGANRYRVGQRLLMMLHTPGPSGISSPVGGMDGAVPIRGIESQISTPTTTTSATVAAQSITPQSSSSATTPSAPVDTVDLRWISARTLRTAVTSGTTVNGTTVSGTGTGDSSVAAQGASVATVLGMLGTWEQARAAH